MSLLAFDNATRSNQSGWGNCSDGINTWSPVDTGLATISIVSDKLEMSAATGDTYAHCGTTTTPDANVTVEWTPSTSSDNGYVVLRQTGQLTHYRFRTDSGGSIAKNIVGTVTALTPLFTSNQTPPTITAGTTYMIHAVIKGSNLYLNIWTKGTAEPLTNGWLVEVSDTSITGAGQFGLGGNLASSSNNITFANFSAFDYVNSNNITLNDAQSALQAWHVDTNTASDLGGNLQSWHVDTNTASDLGGNLQSWHADILNLSYLHTVQSDGPSRYYRLDEASGTTSHDLGSQAQNATLNGTITLSQTGALTGDSDTAMLFDGSTGYISAPTTGIEVTGFSVEIWVNVSSFAKDGGGFNRRIIFCNLDGSNAFQITTVPSNKFVWAVNDAGTQYITSTIGNSVNTWYHLVGTYNTTGHALTLYINGVVATNNGGEVSAGIGSVGFNIGRRPDSTGYFPGLLDEIVIYNYVLTASQVSNHYNAGINSVVNDVPFFTEANPDGLVTYASTVLTDGVMAWYRVDEVSGTIAHDLSGNGYNATLSGTILPSQTGAIASDTDTSMYFDALATLTFPYTLNITTWTAITLEFWIKISSGWNYVAVTCDNTTTITYLNGTVYSSGSGDPVLIAQNFYYAGSYQSGDLDEIAVYNKVLTAAQIQNHYQLGYLIRNDALIASDLGGTLQTWNVDGLTTSESFLAQLIELSVDTNSILDFMLAQQAGLLTDTNIASDRGGNLQAWNVDGLSTADIGNIQIWNIDTNTASDLFLAQMAVFPIDANALTDSFLAQLIELAVDTNSISDLLLAQQAGLLIDTNTSSDIGGNLQIWNIDGLTTSDGLFSQQMELLIDANTASDIGGNLQSWNIDGLNTTDPLLAQLTELAIDDNALSDSLLAQMAVFPIDANALTDSFLAQLIELAVDTNSILDVLLSQQAGLLTDSNTASDLGGNLQAWNVDGLTTSDSLLAQLTELAIDANRVLDVLIAQQEELAVDANTATDSAFYQLIDISVDANIALDFLLASQTGLLTDTNSPTDTLLAQLTVLPIDSNTVSDFLLAYQDGMSTDANTISDVGGNLQIWNIDGLNIAEFLFSQQSILATESNPVGDMGNIQNWNIDSLSISESELFQQSILFLDANSLVDIGNIQSWIIEVLSLSDFLLTQSSILAADTNNLADIGNLQAWNIDGLTIVDSLLNTDTSLPTDSLTVISNSTGQGIYLPSDTALSAIDSLLASELSTFIDANTTASILMQQSNGQYVDLLNLLDFGGNLQSWNVEGLSISENLQSTDISQFIEGLSVLDSILNSVGIASLDGLSIQDIGGNLQMWNVDGLLINESFTIFSIATNIILSVRNGSIVLAVRKGDINMNVRSGDVVMKERLL